MKTTICFCLGAITLLGFSSCTKSSTSKPSTTDNIQGNVILYNEEGDMLNDNGGVTVSIENSNPLISTVTRSDGSFELPSLDSLPESFAVVYSKPNYGTYKSYYQNTKNGLKHLPSSVDVDSSINNSIEANLGAISSVIVNSFSILTTDTSTIFSYNISSPFDGEKYIQFFYQKDIPDFTFATMPKIIDKTFSGFIPVNNGDNSQIICNKCWKECTGYKTGDTLYVTAYGDSCNPIWYINFYTGEFVMPDVNTTNNIKPVQFIIP